MTIKAEKIVKKSKLIEDLKEDLLEQKRIMEECTNDYGHVTNSYRFNIAVLEARNIRNSIEYLRGLGIE